MTRLVLRSIVPFLSALVLIETPLTAIAPPAAATAACSVKNARTGTTYGSLQRAVDHSAKGDTLRVRGTCVGTTSIDRKKLVLIGIPTAGHPTPTLDGGGSARVLVLKHAHVAVKDLTLTNGRTLRYGAGIYEDGGWLALKGDTKVVGNTGAPASATQGGGIYNARGILMLSGSASVTDNEARFGGGIYGFVASLTLSDSSSVSGNAAARSGGGIFEYKGTLTLNDSSSVTGNTAAFKGGGILAVRRAIVYVCSKRVAIRPNTPDDPPKVHRACG